MCTNESGTRLQPLAPSAMLPYPFGALKQLNDAAAVAAAVNTAASPAGLPSSQRQLASSASALIPSSPANAATAAAATTLDHYRLQFYNYAVAERLRYTHQAFFANPYNPSGPSAASSVAHPLHLGRPQDFTQLFLPYGKIDPRFYLRPQEEPKPQYSYIGLIAMAILSSPDKKLVLSDIYQYILDNYSYFRTRGPGWRNSIRHNLSLNDCFIKAGRSANGKGHYWAIHPANVDDFTKGDFRRRKAQRKVRKSMGLSVDEEDSPTPPSSPVTQHPGLSWPGPHHHPHHHPADLGAVMPGMGHHRHPHGSKALSSHETSLPLLMLASSAAAAAAAAAAGMPAMTSLSPSSHSDPENPRKRLFDMASLLAPDDRSVTPNSPPRAESSLASTTGHRGDSVADEDDEGARQTPSPGKPRKTEDEDVDVVSDDFNSMPTTGLASADHPSDDEARKHGLAANPSAGSDQVRGTRSPAADPVLVLDARDAFQSLIMERQHRLSSLNASATPCNWRTSPPNTTSSYPLFPNPSFHMARPSTGVNLARYPPHGTSVLPSVAVNNHVAVFASPIEQLNKYYEQLAETVRLNMLHQQEK